MGERGAPFAAALHRAGRMAARVRLSRHVPTRLRLAAVYAVPVANYGDVVWSTAVLQPGHTMHNPLQRQLLSHMQAVAGVPATTPRWPLLNELGLQPMQRSWWSHVIRFYNKAVSVEGKAASPLMAAALAADVALAKRQGNRKPETWSGQLLLAISAVEAAAAAGQQKQTPSRLVAAVESLQPLPETIVMGLLEEAFKQQWGSAEYLGEPRDPAARHRPDATYNKWFRSTAGTLLAHATFRTSSKDCAEVRASLRMRLGAVSTAVTKGRRSGTMPFETRTCSGCSARGVGSHIEDAQHVCFECPCIKAKLAGLGWDNTPGGAKNFPQLYKKGNVKGGINYVVGPGNWPNK